MRLLLTTIFLFRTLGRHGFHESSSADSLNSSEPSGKPNRPTSSIILTRRRIGTLQDLFSIYPKVASMFRGSIRAANFDRGIKSTDFQSKKERMLILSSLLTNYPDLDARQTRALGNAVLVDGDEQNTLRLLDGFSRGEKGGWFSAPWKGKRAMVSKAEDTWRSANTYSMSVSDLEFLSFVKTIPDGESLRVAADECEETAYDCLTTQLDSLVAGICQQILTIQKEQCDKQVQRKVKNEAEKGLNISRIEFVQRIEALCRKSSRSYVIYSSIRSSLTQRRRSSVYIDDFRTKKEHQYAAGSLGHVERKAYPHYRLDSYFISGRKETLQDQEIEYKVHILRLLADQKHNLQLDPSYVPTPVLHERLSQSFYVSSENVVKCVTS